MWRIEKDSLGEVPVPADAYFGSQTQRALENFPIGTERMPQEIIRAIALIKKASAWVNRDLGLLPSKKAQWIGLVCDEILAGQWDEQFPLRIWQSGSGTQTNMNLNEVISNRANELAGQLKGSKQPIHPNDAVNLSQSSNDVFPSAMHLAVGLLIKQQLFPAIASLQKELFEKSRAFQSIWMVGRTHLMDAAPLTLGQVFSGYHQQLVAARETIEATFPHLFQLALGGTAVGTGLNAPPTYAEKVVDLLSRWTGESWALAPNRFEALSCSDTLVEVSGALRRLALALYKIANDLRWLSSGPHGGIGELIFPENEPGSSIMPGKVNPTQCEMVMMVATHVVGSDAAVAFAGSQGNFQLHVARPLLAYHLLSSIRLLGDAMESFGKRCMQGIRPNRDRIQSHLDACLMLAVLFNPILGYDQTAKMVQKASQEGISLKKAALSLGLLTEEVFDLHLQRAFDL